MQLSIIISYYKAIDNLKLILSALSKQSIMDFEAIISEDDNNKETTQYIKQNRQYYRFPIIHLYQNEDKGFRKNVMLNKSISIAQSNKIAFIDGDCIPHKHFVKAYINNISKNIFLTGRAVMLSKELSQNLLKRENFSGISLLKLIFSKSRKIKDSFYIPLCPLRFKSKGLIGRNWGIFKKYLENINGFDEDYIMAGVGEDVDIEWRLLKSGIIRKSIKNKAIVYHLYHDKKYLETDVQKNYQILEKKMIANNIFCLSGIKKIAE